MRYGETRTVKLYYTISEVVDITSIPAHILRYWEQEFPMLRPRKNRAGNRTYKDKDILLIRRIQQLVQVEKLTLAGARKRIQESGSLEIPEEQNIDTPEIQLPEASIPEANALVEEESAPPTSKRKSAILGELQQIRDLLRSV